MITCGACGTQNPEGFNFCGKCAAPLQAERPVSQERKVVTSLFCDLVAFTAMSEAADPEDVDAVLGRYYQVARGAIEAYGGSVQKFIGDAVVGVFGVPAAHEDDPERAVRAGLRIVEAVEGLTRPDGSPLQLRVGINTGEALVRLDVTPGSGEGFLTGDAVNTAARIQSVAPVMGIAVGRSTYAATRPVFDYVHLESAKVKGKSDPVEVWQAVTPLARLGTDVTRRHDTPLVGREIDLALLKGVFDKTVASSSTQLVTIVGEPGMGKSRLVGELFAHVDARPELVTWRQGRCLPYGEGITFWALGEVVKAHAGIRESDPSDRVMEKLDAVLPDVEQRAWLRQRLLPLLGMEASSRAEQGELFTAWRTFLESVAESGPTVVVFEDLHWADPAMLAFIEHLADQAEGVPLLLLATARPELFERHPDYGRGLRNTATITLTPLDEGETTRLVSALLDTLAVPEELRLPLVERAGGNPLFAEEYVRLLQDRDLVEHVDEQVRLRPGAELPLPDSVQALIAARLDTLTPDRKALLADAAVIGKVFWAGAVAAMSGTSEEDVVAALREMSRKELVRPVRRSSMTAQQEYTFWHVLTRDVAYAQLPRASRAAQHVSAAEWVEAHAGERVDDVSDVLVHHFVTALALAEAADDDGLAAEVAPRARQALLRAGQRSLNLDPAVALEFFRRAQTMTGTDDAAQAAVLLLVGEAAYQSAQTAVAADALSVAIDHYRRHGPPIALGRALTLYSGVLNERQDGDWAAANAEAVELLETLPPGPELVAALTFQAFSEIRHDHLHAAVTVADRALVVADRAGLPVPSSALAYRGVARSLFLGERAGIQDLRRAVDLLVESGSPRSLAGHYGNLANAISMYQGYGAQLATLREAAALLKSRGLESLVSILVNLEKVWAELETGNVDLGETMAEELVVELAGKGDVAGANYMRAALIRAWSLRGEPGRAEPLVSDLLATSRAAANAEDLLNGLGPAAVVHAALGRRDDALALFQEVAVAPDMLNATTAQPWLTTWTRTLVDLGHAELAAEILAGFATPSPLRQFIGAAARARLGEVQHGPEPAERGYRDAAAQAQRFGSVIEEAYALLGQGRCLLALERPGEAAPVLQQARDMFTKMGARPALAETETLLACVM